MQVLDRKQMKSCKSRGTTKQMRADACQISKFSKRKQYTESLENVNVQTEVSRNKQWGTRFLNKLQKPHIIRHLDPGSKICTSWQHISQITVPHSTDNCLWIEVYSNYNLKAVRRIRSCRLVTRAVEAV